MPKHPSSTNTTSQVSDTPQHLTLLQIFNAVNDKEKLFKIHSDSPKACPLGGKIKGLLTTPLLKAQEALEDSLRSITLQDLLDELINL
mgnify:FL=1